jgi:F-type H+-transporting ATPase subunit epsilon
MSNHNLLKVDVVTPMGEIYKGECLSVQAPGTEGLFQVLPGHTAFLTQLGIGALKVVEENGKEQWFAVNGGFCQVSDDKVSVLSDSAEKSADIDIERAERAKKRALERIHGRQEGIDQKRAEAALSRALNRMKIARLSK